MTDTITLVRGGDYPLPFTLRDENGPIADIAAWTIRADLIAAQGGAVLAALTVGNGKVTVGATSDDITFTIAGADVALLPDGRRSKLKVYLTDGSGRDLPPVAWWIVVDRDGDVQDRLEGLSATIETTSIAATIGTRQGPAGSAGANPAGALLYDADQTGTITSPQALQARANIGAQAASAILSAIASLTLSAGEVVYATGPDTFDVAASTSFGRSVLNIGGAAAGRALLGAVAQSDIDAAIAALAASSVTSVAGRTGAVTLAQADIAGLTSADAPALKGLSLTGGAVTASSPLLSATQNWNSSGTAFTGLKLNVTDTASAAASLLLDLQVGGSSKASISKAGAATFAGNLSGPPNVFLAGGGITNNLSGSSAGFDLGFNGGWLLFGSGWSLRWSSGSSTASSADTIVTRAAAGVVAFNGTIQMASVPTADPHVNGRVWSNAGVLTVSAG